MKRGSAFVSRAIHPAFVPIPIGAFALSLVADLVHSITGDPFWYRFAFTSMGVGVLTGFLAAIVGMFDDLDAEPGSKTAAAHMLLNLGSVALYLANLSLRRDGAALHAQRWPFVVGMSLVTFVALCASAWLGRRLAAERRLEAGRRREERSPMRTASAFGLATIPRRRDP